MQSSDVINFPRQKEHYCTTGSWKLLKTKMNVDKTAHFACAHRDVELGDILYVMGTDDVMHRSRVTMAYELENPIKAHGSDQEFWMLVTVKLADSKGLTGDCDITNI